MLTIIGILLLIPLFAKTLLSLRAVDGVAGGLELLESEIIETDGEPFFSPLCGNFKESNELCSKCCTYLISDSPFARRNSIRFWIKGTLSTELMLGLSLGSFWSIFATRSLNSAEYVALIGG